MNKTRYTVLTMNMGSYELVHPVLGKSDRARYVMVTDDPNLKDESGTWEIVYDDTLEGTPWEKTLQVRYNPFKYTDDPIVIKIDGSVGVNKSLDNLVDRFEKEDYDMSLMVHPTRNTLVQEYTAWVKQRQYPVEKANAILSTLAQAEGFPVNDYKGLAQLCFWIQRNTQINHLIDSFTHSWCKYFSDKNGEIERVDQAIASFVIQKYFPMCKIMFVDQRMYQSDYFTWYPHNSNQPFSKMYVKDMIEPFWMNKRLHNVVRPQDL